MAPLRLLTLGRLALVRPAGAPAAATAPTHRRELLLLAYLARVAPRAVAREELAALFWGEREERRARQSLREALYNLRRAVGDAIEVDASQVRLASSAVEFDVTAFEAEVAAGQLAQAVARWEGEFLSGAEEAAGEAFRSWLHAERDRLRRQLGWALDRLTDDATLAGDWAAAVRWAEFGAELRPLDEESQLRLVHVLVTAGRRADAIGRHAAFVGRFREERGIECSAEFMRAGAKLASDRHAGSAALLAPDLVGREAELAALRLAWEHARRHAGAVVLIEGDEGSGKTRCCREFLRELRNSGEPLLVLRAESRDGREPRAWSGMRSLLDGLRQAPALGSASPGALSELSGLAPWLRERYPHLSLPRDDEETLGAAMHEVLSAVAEEIPIIVLADDFPALGASTRTLLRSLMQRLPVSVLVLLTAAPSPAESSPLGTGEAPPDFRRIGLLPLSQQEVDTLLASMMALDPRERSGLAALLREATGGLPFNIVEMVFALADGGLLSLQAGGTWRVPADLGGQLLPLPSGVREATRRRLNHLGAPARALCEVAAVLGRRFDPALLDAVSERPAEELGDALAELIARRLLVPVTTPLLRYEFAHELLWRAAYEVIPAGRRQALHAAALAALVSLPGESSLDDCAREYHRTRAGAVPVPIADPRVGWLRGRRPWLAATITIVVSAATIVMWRGVPAFSADAAPRLLVVSLANESGDTSLNALGNIAADWLTQGISRTTLAKVAPPAFGTLGGGAEPAPADRASHVLSRAREAHADIVVSGSYWTTTDSIHFRAVVTDARQEELLTVVEGTSAAISRPIEAIGRLQRAVVASLAPRLDSRMVVSAGVQSTPPSYEAYHAFATGLGLLFDRRPDALPHFLRAYALDTSYTLPLLYAGVVHDGTGRMASLDSLTQRLMPRRAELAPFDQRLLDVLVGKVRGDRAGTLAAARAMVDVAPGSVLAVFYLAQSALTLNRPREAAEALAALDPVRAREQRQGMTGYWSMLAGAYHMLGDYERQLDVGQTVGRELPQDVRHLLYKARALAALGRHRELIATLEESLLQPHVREWGAPGMWLHLVAADELRAHGDSAMASVVLHRALQFYRDTPPDLRAEPAHWFDVAKALSATGSLAESRRILERLHTEYPRGWLGVGEAVLRAHVGYVAAAQGDTAAAAEADRWLAANSQPYHFGQSTEYRAGIAALLGHREQAVRLLHRATAEGRPFDSGKHAAYEFHPLRGYPPFERWLKPRG